MPKQASSNNLNNANTNMVRPFLIEQLNVRGRILQLTNPINNILNLHKYPAPVANLLSQAINLTAIIATSLNFNGRFTMQTKTNGVVNMLICDFFSPNKIRAYAKFDQAALEQQFAQNPTMDPNELLGEGVLSLIIDLNNNQPPYQGIVALNKETSLATAVETYFLQSEQTTSFLKLASKNLYEEIGQTNSFITPNLYRSCGIFIQKLPNTSENAWQETLMLANTLTADEMLDPNIKVDNLLYRLFNEYDIKIFEALEIINDCSCSQDKISQLVNKFSESELESYKEADGHIHIKCEFCSESYKV